MKAVCNIVFSTFRYTLMLSAGTHRCFHSLRVYKCSVSLQLPASYREPQSLNVYLGTVLPEQDRKCCALQNCPSSHPHLLASFRYLPTSITMHRKRKQGCNLVRTPGLHSQRDNTASQARYFQLCYCGSHQSSFKSSRQKKGTTKAVGHPIEADLSN